MAAPTNTIWGNAGTGNNGYQGKIGVYVTTSSTDTTTTISVDVYYWSQYSVNDSSNTFDCTIGSDTKTWSNQSINTTSNSSFSESNQVKIGSHSYTFNRGTSASSKTITATFSGIDYGGSNGSVSTTTSVPALPTYTVSYNANGGSGAPSSQTKIHNVALTLSSTIPTRSGYEFIGWGVSASDTTSDYSAGGSYTSNGAITLYAIWRAAVSLNYNANGGSSAPSNQNDYIYNATTSKSFVISSTTPTRLGYSFLGWSTSSTATSSDYSPNGSVSVSAGKSITLYAVWSENYLTVNYYSNYADIGTDVENEVGSDKNVLVKTIKYYYDNTYTNGLINYTSTENAFYLSKTGYTSTRYWGTSTTGGTLIHQATEFESGQALAAAFGKSLESGNVSVDVYAQWSENYLTINYYSNYATSFAGKVTQKNEVNGDNVNVWTQNYYYDNAYPYGLTNYKNSGSDLHMIRTGYFATGYWGTSVTGGTLIDELASFTSGQELAKSFGLSLETENKSVDIYAQWKHANVVYWKMNNKYVLCNIYEKVNNKWEPCLCYMKTNDEWKLGGN